MECSMEIRKPLSFGSLSRDFYYANLLIDEVIAENIVAVKRLLDCKEARADTVVPERGAAALHLLAGMENEEFSTSVTSLVLLRGGTDPNVRSEEGLTPVHVAATYGRCKVLEVLLTNGGDQSLLDYRLLLDAEGHALREGQWRAHWMLKLYAAIVEDPDHFAKYLSDIPSRDEDYTMVGETLPNKKAIASKFDQDFEDYYWISSAQKVIPLDDNSIRIIKSHRENTKTYQYPSKDVDEDSLRRCQDSRRSYQVSPRTYPYPRVTDKESSSPYKRTRETGKESLSTVFKYTKDINKDKVSSFKTKLSNIVSSKHDVFSKYNESRRNKYDCSPEEGNESTISSGCSQENRQGMVGEVSKENCRSVKKNEKAGPKKVKNQKGANSSKSEMFYCEFAEQQVLSKRGRSRSSTTCPGDDSFASRTPSNKVLYKMSRMFLFMLRKRHLDQEVE